MALHRDTNANGRWDPDVADPGQPVRDPHEHHVPAPPVGLASVDGLVLVPAVDTLVADG